jgi:hypothetical protein
MSWNDFDMESKRWEREFDRRVAEGRKAICDRIARVEQRCKEAEEDRRREWEELTGRVMSAQEEQKHQSDGVLRLMSAVTAEYLTIARNIGKDLREEFAENRAETRANTEAVMRMLDRLPPPAE